MDLGSLLNAEPEPEPEGAGEEQQLEHGYSHDGTAAQQQHQPEEQLPFAAAASSAAAPPLQQAVAAPPRLTLVTPTASAATTAAPPAKKARKRGAAAAASAATTTEHHDDDEYQASRPTVSTSTWKADEWANSLDQLGAEDVSELERHAHVYRAYIDSIAQQTAESRRLGVLAYSALQTSSLLATAHRVTAFGGSSLTSLVEETSEAARLQQLQRVQQREVAAEKRARVQREQDELREKAERKREAAREGWKKRRVTLEEKKQYQENERVKALREGGFERKTAFDLQGRVSAAAALSSSLGSSGSSRRRPTAKQQARQMQMQMQMQQEEEIDPEEIDELADDTEDDEMVGAAWEQQLGTAYGSASSSGGTTMGYSGSGAATEATAEGGGGSGHDDSRMVNGDAHQRSRWEEERYGAAAASSHSLQPSASSSSKGAAGPLVDRPTQPPQPPGAGPPGEAGQQRQQQQQQRKRAASSASSSVTSHHHHPHDAAARVMPSLDDIASRGYGLGLGAASMEEHASKRQRIDSPGIKVERFDDDDAYPERRSALTGNGYPSDDGTNPQRSSPALFPGGPEGSSSSNRQAAGAGGRASSAALLKPGQPNVDLERKVWSAIARSAIPKVIKAHQQGVASRAVFHRRLSGAAAREAKKYNSKHPKAPKDVGIKARRVMREMLMHLKGNEKSQRESKRKVDKELLDKSRKEEEAREAQRQSRKLNFLITQTELYSHFVGSKLKTSEMEESADTAGTSTADKNGAPGPAPESALIKALAEGGDAEAAALRELDFGDADESNLISHARKNALAAAEIARNKAKQFDSAYASEQAASKENKSLSDEEAELENGGDAAMARLAGDKAGDKEMGKIDLDDMNFQNPTMLGDVSVKQPAMLTCQLKEYQLKGLNWLANLYEQGINGILADEMGLGKTVQSISLMSYLAEEHNIWGPFLVVAPASTLHNWQQEITKFAPALKVLPYWGNVKDRTTLRKFWNRKSLRYDRNAPFHVLITSYQLVVTDEQYFNKVKWQYMVLDEAQAIKSSASSRWKILLGMNCRNRLLLTGTPIQNSMQELWALLHFIMPSLFDSHNEFSEWFAKDIEGNADKNGGMNAHQLRRLHMILKPFMLRRIKKNVQNELADKIEIDVYCDLTPRQRQMYRTLRQNISIADLVKRAASLSDDESVKRLMNLIMQFRKVCNHPELFERADVEAPFSFADYSQSYNLNREGNSLEVLYATNSYLDVRIPKLFLDDPINDELQQAGETNYVGNLMNIWTKSHITQSAHAGDAFAFMKAAELDAQAVHTLARSRDPLQRLSIAQQANDRDAIRIAQSSISEARSQPLSLKTSKALPDDPSWRYLGLPPLASIQEDYRDFSRYNRADTRFYIDPAQAPPPALLASSRSFAYKQQDARHDLATRTALYGTPGETNGILGSLSKAQMPLAPMEVPQLHKLILDSGKLAKLDELLTQLKAGGHRVLVYFQMTRMIDLMEEYLAFRQHKYLRLDGSSSISERRDMVGDWQSKPEIFIFLLSTRAGGLGINLTAADTVVFYDSDWNPSNDSQAMDRAHRLGQQRQVTVYRLITKNTIDERILALARNKKVVQDAVVGSSTQVVGGSSGEVKGNEVVNLLLDDDELAETLQQSEAMKENKGRAKDIAASARSNGRNASSSGLGGAAAGHGWDNQDEDDDAFGFFSNTTNKPSRDPDDDGDLDGGGGEGQGDAGDAGGAKGKGKGKAKAPRAPAKPRARKPKEPEDPNAPPKKRARAPKKKEEPEIGPDGQPIIPEKNPRGGWPKGKPRGKKLAITPNTVGSSNPAFDTEGSLNTSAAQTPMHLD